MSQSSVILATLLAGFVAYLALNGKLSTYWTLLAGGGSSSASGSAGTSSGAGASNPAGSAGDVLSTASDFASYGSEIVSAFAMLGF